MALEHQDAAAVEEKPIFGSARAIRCADCGVQFGTVLMKFDQSAPPYCATFRVMVKGMKAPLKNENEHGWEISLTESEGRVVRARERGIGSEG